MIIEAYHSSDDADLVARRLLHVGTLEQATMRGGRHLHRVMVDAAGRQPRVRDRGDWRPRTLLRHRARVLVYLNRHEGIPLDEFEAARAHIALDRASDRDFRRHVPSARDSWIVIDPKAIVSIERMR